MLPMRMLLWAEAVAPKDPSRASNPSNINRFSRFIAFTFILLPTNGHLPSGALVRWTSGTPSPSVVIGEMSRKL